MPVAEPAPVPIGEVAPVPLAGAGDVAVEAVLDVCGLLAEFASGPSCPQAQSASAQTTFAIVWIRIFSILL